MIRYKDKIYSNKDVAILLATYNGERYLEEQLNSLLKQSFSEFVCFIHDDGSTDRSEAIINRYCSAYPDKFVNVGSERCGGAKQNFMFLLREIQADYVMFCDQDDYWMAEKVKKTLDVMKGLEEKYGTQTPLCVYSDLKVVDSRLETIADSYFMYMGKNPNANGLIDLLKVNVTVGCTMMINLALRKETIKLQNDENVFMHDWWCALICSAIGKFGFISEPLMLYRQHEGNAVGAHSASNLVGKLRKLADFSKWVRFRRMKMNRPRNFAKELITVIPAENSQYEFLCLLAKIESQGKIKRAHFYFENDLFIENSNKVVQLIFV